MFACVRGLAAPFPPTSPLVFPQAASTTPSEHDQRSGGRTDNGQANASNHCTDLVGFAA